MKKDDLLGFIGAIVGVIGAFLLYRHQLNNEKLERNKLNSKILKELLIYTVSETEKIVKSIINIYINFYIDKSRNLDKDDIGLRILQSNIEKDDTKSFSSGIVKYRYAEKTFPHMIEKFAVEDIFHKNEYGVLFNDPMDKQLYEIMYYDFETFREDIIVCFRRLENIDNLIYDNNWTQYIHNTEDISFEDIKSIIKWLNIAPKSVESNYLIQKDLQIKVNELNKKKEILNNIKEYKNTYSFEIDESKYIKDLFSTFRLLHHRKHQEEQLKKDIINHICDFIYYRDEIINILIKKFNDETFKTSTQIIKNELNTIKNELNTK